VGRSPRARRRWSACVRASMRRGAAASSVAGVLPRVHRPNRDPQEPLRGRHSARTQEVLNHRPGSSQAVHGRCATALRAFSRRSDISCHFVFDRRDLRTSRRVVLRSQLRLLSSFAARSIDSSIAVFALKRRRRSTCDRLMRLPRRPSIPLLNPSRSPRRAISRYVWSKESNSAAPRAVGDLPSRSLTCLSSHA